MGGCGPIPWSSMDDYARKNGFEGDDYDDLMKFVGFLDGLYLKHVSDDLAKRRPKGRKR